jgi:hypothetical protein
MADGPGKVKRLNWYCDEWEEEENFFATDAHGYSLESRDPGHPCRLLEALPVKLQ